MGLDNDLYTLLNSSWVTATIAKPTFHLNPDKVARVQTRHLFIQTSNIPIKIDEASNDMSMQEKQQQFSITGWEGSEDDCVKCLKICKTLLLNASVTNGMYVVTQATITENNQLKQYAIQGFLNKLIEDDDI